MRKHTLFLLVFLLLTACLLCACSPATLSDTTAAPQTTTAPDTTTAPEETTAPTEETTAPMESIPNPDLSVGLSFGSPPAETDELLCFPGLPWGITLDEALDVLKLEESQYELVEDDIGIRQRLNFYNAEWFGEAATQALLIFDSNQLVEIYIAYPDDADMQKVKENLESIYGSPSDKFTRYRRQLSFENGYEKGAVVSAEYPSDDQTVFWVSDVHYDDYLGEVKTAEWINQTYAANPDSTKEAYEKVAALNAFSHVVWSTNGTGDYVPYNTPNIVTLACDLFSLSLN